MKQAQKAVTAALVPIVLALLAGALDRAGVDIPVEPSAVEAVVAAAVSAFFVWLVPNQQAE